MQRLADIIEAREAARLLMSRDSSPPLTVLHFIGLRRCFSRLYPLSMSQPPLSESVRTCPYLTPLATARYRRILAACAYQSASPSFMCVCEPGSAP